MSAYASTGLQSLGELPWGSHICQFFAHGCDLRDTLIPYFKAGLENNERCLLVAMEPFTAEDARSALRASVGDFDRRERRKQIEIHDVRAWYNSDSIINGEEIVAGLLASEEKARADGYNGFRTQGNIGWLGRSQWDDFQDYEARVTRGLRGRRMISMCSYCLDSCGPKEFLDVTTRHSHALTRQRNDWSCVAITPHEQNSRSVGMTEERQVSAQDRFGRPESDEADERRLDSPANEMAGLIASKDWSTTALGERNNWSANLKLIVGLITASGFPMAVRWGPELVLIYNDGYRSILADKHPWALGLPFRDVWPEVVSELVPLHEAILAGESPGVYSEDRPFTIRRRGKSWETAHFNVSYSPILDPSSPTGIGGVLITAVETTERLRIEKALELKTRELSETLQQLQDGQALYRSALAAGRLGTWETDLVAKIRFWTPEGMALFGINPPNGRGQVGGAQDEYWSALHPDDRHLVGKFHELADKQDSFTSEYRVVRPDGTSLWLRGNGRVVARTPDGKAHRLVSIVADVTERKLAEQALRESEERLRMASASAKVGIWDYDLTTNTLRWDERTRALFGLSQDAPVSYDVFLAGLHPDDRDVTHAANQRAIDPTGSGEYDIEYRTVGLDDGITRWIAAKGKCYFENGEAVRYIGTVLDIERAKKSEELQEVLLREMDHRVKNLFAIVSSMTALSARSARTPQEMSQSLRGRLDALSRANDLVRPGVTGSEPLLSERTTIAALVNKVLLPFADENEGYERVFAKGPDVPVGAKAVTSLALVLHESATNAAKHGALSNPAGSIRIGWGTEDDKLWLHWEENGGPAISHPPQARGFGSTLAERSISGQLGGTIAFEWRPEGVKLNITIPLERLEL